MKLTFEKRGGGRGGVGEGRKEEKVLKCVFDCNTTFYVLL
jgi:hypothetical protein